MLEPIDPHAEGQTDYRFIDANPAFHAQLGLAEVIGSTLRKVFDGEPEAWFELHDEVLRSGRARRFQHRLKGDGRVFDLRIHRFDGTRPRLAVLAADLSVRSSAQLALQQAQVDASAEATQRAAILGQLAEGVIITDRSGQITLVNDAAEQLHGMKMLGIAPADYTDTYHLLTVDGQPHPPHELPLARAVLNGETVTDARWRIQRADGTHVLAIGSACPINGHDGEPLGAVLTFRDDTKRAQAEDRLREQTRTLEILNRTGAALAGELDLQRLVQQVTDAGVEITGAQFGAFFYNVLDEAGESLMLYTLSGAERSAFDRFGMPRATAVFQPTFKGEGVIRSDDILADARYGLSGPHHGLPSGHLPVRSYLAVPVTSRTGEVIGGLFFGNAEPAIFNVRHERLIVGLAGQASISIDNARLFQKTQLLNETLEARVEERTAERDRLWLNTQDLQVVIDNEGAFKAVSPAVERILGWTPEEMVGRTVFDFVVADDQGITSGALDAAIEGALPSFENRYRHKDGGHRWISWVAAPEGELIYASGRHITAEKTQAEALAIAQDALRQSQKMEAVGQLTGGIAHDFNNMLAVVIGSLDLMSRRLGPGDERYRRYIDAATEGAERAAVLTQRLLAFSRQQPLRPQAVDINKLVAGMSELIRGSTGSHIGLETVLSAGAWRTHVDPNQLESVILNLAVNARDAMPDGGRLTLETQNAHIDARYAAAHIGVPPGHYVLLAVSDTGTGMTETVIAKAFDPFFTTKDVGKGTGLGLSQVYGYVKQSGGHVKIYSEPGEGTTVKVYLPRLCATVEDTTGEDELSLDFARGDSSDVVLLVEDEPAVREFCVEALVELGYRVLEADGASAALRLLDAHPEITLMFTDIVMPEVNGARLAEEARRRRPGLKVLFTTGYTRNAVVHNGVLDAGVQMISKPYTIEELAMKVREVLDATAN